MRLFTALPHQSFSHTCWIQDRPATVSQIPWGPGEPGRAFRVQTVKWLAGTSAPRTYRNTRACILAIPKSCPEQPRQVWTTYVQEQPYQVIKMHLWGQPHKTSWYPYAFKHDAPMWYKQDKVSAYLLGWSCFCTTKRNSLRRRPCITEESPIHLPALACLPAWLTEGSQCVNVNM